MQSKPGARIFRGMSATRPAHEPRPRATEKHARQLPYVTIEHGTAAWVALDDLAAARLDLLTLPGAIEIEKARGNHKAAQVLEKAIEKARDRLARAVDDLGEGWTRSVREVLKS